MFRNRNAGKAGAGFLRTRVRPVVRRVAHAGPMERVLSPAHKHRAMDPLLDLYEALRRAYAPQRVPQARVPAPTDVRTVREDALRGKVFADFFQMAGLDGDIDRALVEMTRSFLARSEPSRPRSIAQVFARYEPLRPIADVCLALCALFEPMPEPAWTLFTRTDLALVLRWAPVEYFQLGFTRDPDTAAASLGRALTGEVPMDAPADTWLQTAYFAFAAEYLELAEQSLKRAESAIADVRDAERAARLNARLATLRSWLDRAALAAQPVEAPAGEVPFALVGFAHPDWRAMSTDVDDPIETLATLGHLLARDGVTFTGDPALVAAAEQLRAGIPQQRRRTGEPATVRLYEVERDVSRYSTVPESTWLIVSEWFRAPLGGTHFDMPLHPNLRPLFVSFHITPDQLAVPGVIDYLRAHGPIGCRDWDSVFLLLAADVPAFFSGALTTTVDTVVPPTPQAAGSGTVFVDVPGGEGGEQRSRLAAAQKERDLAANLTSAAETLRRYRDGGARVVTSAVRFYLAARSVGCPAELRLKDAGDHRAVDVRALSDEQLTAMRDGISAKLATALDAVLAGRPDDAVYAAWQQACGADVERARAELSSSLPDLKPTFDIDEACRVIHAASVVVERRQDPPGAGAEINVEFSVDQNYKHQLEIVLDSVVQRTDRPVRAFILCRGLGKPDFDRLARHFPTVSFVWLPTDNVDYGPIPDKIRWATIVTMDRTMLPELLADVDRILHFDLDALCLADLGELFDVDLEGTAIAAIDAPQPVYLSGLETFRRTAHRLRRDGEFDVARELIIRTHKQHPFDFEIFNAGIMVLDLAKMRADNVCRRYLGYIQRYGVNGQVIMNLFVGRERKKVHADWNRLVRLEIAGPPKIAHWAGPYKPWRGHHYVPGREWWQEQEEHFAARTERLTDAATPVR